MGHALATTFSFKFILLSYTFIVLNIGDICVYFITALSKKSMTNDEKYFNCGYLNRPLHIKFAQIKRDYTK